MNAAAEPRHEASAWLRGSVAAALQAIIADPDARMCPHVGHLWCLTLHDQRMRCPRCTVRQANLQRTLDPAEDHTCDRCRALVPTVTPVVLDLGPVMVALGLCPGCLAREGGSPRAAR